MAAKPVARPIPKDAVIRRRMENTRRRDTGPELLIRSCLHRLGLRFRVDVSPVPGMRARADIVFRSERVAVFVDGCFWHGCPEHGTMPKNNRDWWKAKLRANVERDRRVDSLLDAAGWTVVRFWEHENPEHAARRVARVVARRRALEPTA